MQLPVDPAFAKGAVYRGNDANTESFPEGTPPSPILFGKNIQRFSLHDAAQRNLVIHLPGHSYLQVEDWRDKTPSEFAIRIISPMMSPDMSMHIGDPPSTRAPANQPALDIPHAQGAHHRQRKIRRMGRGSSHSITCQPHCGRPGQVDPPRA